MRVATNKNFSARHYSKLFTWTLEWIRWTEGREKLQENMANPGFSKRCTEKIVKYIVGYYIFHLEKRMICTGTVRIDS